MAKLLPRGRGRFNSLFDQRVLCRPLEMCNRVHPINGHGASNCLRAMLMASRQRALRMDKRSNLCSRANLKSRSSSSSRYRTHSLHSLEGRKALWQVLRRSNARRCRTYSPRSLVDHKAPWEALHRRSTLPSALPKSLQGHNISQSRSIRLHHFRGSVVPPHSALEMCLRYGPDLRAHHLRTLCRHRRLWSNLDGTRRIPRLLRASMEQVMRPHRAMGHLGRIPVPPHKGVPEAPQDLLCLPRFRCNKFLIRFSQCKTQAREPVARARASPKDPQGKSNSRRRPRHRSI